MTDDALIPSCAYSERHSRSSPWLWSLSTECCSSASLLRLCACVCVYAFVLVCLALNSLNWIFAQQATTIEAAEDALTSLTLPPVEFICDVNIFRQWILNRIYNLHFGCRQRCDNSDSGSGSVVDVTRDFELGFELENYNGALYLAPPLSLSLCFALSTS